MNTATQHSVRQWWLSLTVGIIYLILGSWVFFQPLQSFLALTGVFIIGFAIVGSLGVFYALSNRNKLEHWGWVLLTGLIDWFIAFVLLIIPDFSEEVLRLYVGFVLMFRSFLGIGFSVYLAHYKVRNWLIVLLLSTLGVIFSLLMIWNPSFGILTLTFSTSIALFSVGFSQIGIAYELRRHERTNEQSGKY